MSETIDRRVARLEAVQAIRDLKSTYHTYVNDTAFDKVPDLFTDDAVRHEALSDRAEVEGLRRLAVAAAG